MKGTAGSFFFNKVFGPGPKKKRSSALLGPAKKSLPQTSCVHGLDSLWVWTILVENSTPWTFFAQSTRSQVRPKRGALEQKAHSLLFPIGVAFKAPVGKAFKFLWGDA